MSETVGTHGVAAFANPSNGDTLDATIVKGNDNTLRAAYVDHDNDSGLHFQSSALASRPAAGTTGRKWLTNDSGSVKIFYDNGTAWEEVAYVPSTGTATLSACVITGNLTVDTNTLFVNASTNRVGIGTATPASGLDVALAASFSAGVTISSGGLIVSSGGVTVVGTVTATAFAGSLSSSDLTGALPALNGSALTNLNASNIASGTVDAARLPSTLNATTIDGISLSTISGTQTISTSSAFHIIGAQLFGLSGATPKFDLRPSSSYVFDGPSTAMGNWDIAASGSTSISSVSNPTGLSTRTSNADRFFVVRSGGLNYYIRLERWS